MIKRIEIKNYKSLRDVSVDFDPLTVLIGKSGSGKTNFVAAIRFLRDYLTNRGDSLLRQQGGWGNIFNATADDRFMSFRVVFALGAVEGDFDYEIEFAPHDQHRTMDPIQFWNLLLSGQMQFQISSESLKVGPDTLFSQRNAKWVVPPHVAQPPHPSNLVLGLIYGVPGVQLAYQFLTRSVGCYDFPSTVLAARNGQQQNGLRAGFQDDGTNYLETFASISDDLSDSGAFGEIIAGVRKLTPSIKSIELETQKRSEIWVGHQVGENPVMTLSLSQQSEGMRRFLAQMLALYQVPRKQTLIFEEPEKGIYPGALQVLADYFKSEAEQRSQIILTTHNPLLLDQLPIDSLRVVELDSHATRIGRLSKEQLQVVKEHLLSPGELLTVDEARSNFERPLAG